MSWNYRVIKQTNGEEDWYQIHEVYYKKNGKIQYWSLNPISAGGDSLGELMDDLQMMMDARKKPILMERKIRGKDKLVEVV